MLTLPSAFSNCYKDPWSIHLYSKQFREKLSYSNFLSFFLHWNSHSPQRYWDDFWYKKHVIRISLVFYYDYPSESEDTLAPLEQ